MLAEVRVREMIYLSVISHSHEKVLMELGVLASLAQSREVVVVLKDNVGSPVLRRYCMDNNVRYLDSLPGKGFGENNNIVFRHIEQEIGFNAGDFFITLNPDVTVGVAVVVSFIEQLTLDRHRLGTINLFRDAAMTVHDPSIRRFPSPMDIISSRILGNSRNRYDKENISTPCSVEWASGAFLAFDWELYKELQGFDERYFMYFEDVDICRRSLRQFNSPVWFYPRYKAVHYAAHANRVLLSRHSLWFMVSFLRYLLSK